MKIAFFHRIYLIFLMMSGMASIGTGILYVRWKMGTAIGCLRECRGKKTGQKDFRMEREWIYIPSRERIGGEA